jgi:hypothetical protein
MTKTLFALLISLCLTVVAHGQVSAMDEHKLDAFAHAIAHAEGFGVRNTIPTRYHNPGDIRSRRGGRHYAGQVGLNRHGYVIFKNDAAGFAALKDQLRLMVSGQSKHYGADMTLERVARIYATGWKRWAKNVAKQLGVSPSVTLVEYFDIPPSVQVSDDGHALSSILTFTPVLPASPNELSKEQEKALDDATLQMLYQQDQDNLQRQTFCI